MAGWDEILRELGETLSQVDYLREKYIKNLEKVTNRNVIVYYSGFLTKQGPTDLNDNDMNGFMNSLKGADCSKGLDLILHTPGGSPVAAEAIVKYLKKKFNNDIRVIVPQIAMSAGTMIACAGKEIVMGKQSSLGPIDPQFNGIPAYNIIKEFEEAKDDLAKHPENTNYWALQLNKYPAAFVISAQDAINLSNELVRQWLGDGMFDANADGEKIENIAKKLNEHYDSKEHGRHLNIDFCKDIGLKIVELENDMELQDAVLSVHHICMITLNNTSACKIIQSSKKAWIMTVGE